MGKAKSKVNIKRILLYVAAVILIVSAVAYFLPIIKHVEPFSKRETLFSGFDFTKALIFEPETSKMMALDSLLESEKTALMVKIVAIASPICFVVSLLMVVFSVIATYKPKFNNIFIIMINFVAGAVFIIAVLNLISNLTVVNGEFLIQNYSVAIGSYLMVGGILLGSIVGGVANYVE